MSTARVIPIRPAPQVEGIEVTEISAAEFLDAQNGRLKLPVPHVKGELVREMSGPAPEWTLS